MSSPSNNTPSTDRQVLELAKDYLARVETYAKDYQKSISLLDKARNSYEKSWWRNLLEFIKVLSPFITVLLVYWVINTQECGTTIKALGVEFTKACPSK